jgi:hypothetical protein
MRAAYKWQPPAKLDAPTRGWPETRLMALAYVVGVSLYGDGYTSYSPGKE